MKAISYLQKLGAIPQYNLWDIKMAIIVIADELFCEESVMEPDCVEWTQAVNHDHELFEQRCDLILYATSSNIPELMRVMKPIEDRKLLIELIRELLELRLFFFSMEIGMDPGDFDDSDEKFTKLYNEFVGLRPSQQFDSKSQILQFYCSGSITEIGESALKKRGIPVISRG